jgi:hypothetical protein
MIRTAFFVATVVVAAAFATGTYADQNVKANVKNLTVIPMNEAYPQTQVLTVEQCAVEDCSDTPSTT